MKNGDNVRFSFIVITYSSAYFSRTEDNPKTLSNWIDSVIVFSVQKMRNLSEMLTRTSFII